jgi:hypothetical protein
MVSGKIVEGSPREIAEQLSKMFGERRVSVMLMEKDGAAFVPPTPREVERLLAEMHEDAVSVGHVDDSREGIYGERGR